MLACKCTRACVHAQCVYICVRRVREEMIATSLLCVRLMMTYVFWARPPEANKLFILLESCPVHEGLSVQHLPLLSCKNLAYCPAGRADGARPARRACGRARTHTHTNTHTHRHTPGASGRGMTPLPPPSGLAWGPRAGNVPTNKMKVNFVPV